jgi:AcrR family transcriptional regulator
VAVVKGQAKGPVKRRYDTSRRRAQAAATRQEVIDSAGRLFVQRGYAATTVDQVAAEAGVSRETIFKSFGTKRELLRLWLEQSVAGPDEPTPVAEQQWVQQIRDAPDRRKQLEIGIGAARRIHERTIDVLEVVRAAAHAEPEVADLWNEIRDRRRDDVSMIASLFGARTEEQLDVTFALTSPEFYDLLVRQSAWEPERFERWVVDELLHLLEP